MILLSLSKKCVSNTDIKKLHFFLCQVHGKTDDKEWSDDAIDRIGEKCIKCTVWASRQNL